MENSLTTSICCNCLKIRKDIHSCEICLFSDEHDVFVEQLKDLAGVLNEDIQRALARETPSGFRHFTVGKAA